MKTEPQFSWKLAFVPKELCLASVLVIIDQITKYYVRAHISEGARGFNVIPGFFDIVHTQNKGAAFGMFNEASPQFRMLFFSAVTVICLALLMYWLGTSPLKEKLQRLSLTLILGGALGNVIDRAWFGQVTDFLDVYVGSYHWPAFNVADSAISVGVCLIFMKLIPESIQDFLKPKKKA
jgi:signal peptidase II